MLRYTLLRQWKPSVLPWYVRLYYRNVRKFSPSAMYHATRNTVLWFGKVCRYAVLLWNDRDFDYSYLFVLLKYKLQRMEHDIRVYGYADSHLRTAKQIRYAIYLIDRYQGDYTPDSYMLMTQKEAFEVRDIEHKIKQDAKRRLFKHLDTYLEKWWD